MSTHACRYMSRYLNCRWLSPCLQESAGQPLNLRSIFCPSSVTFLLCCKQFTSQSLSMTCVLCTLQPLPVYVHVPVIRQIRAQHKNPAVVLESNFSLHPSAFRNIKQDILFVFFWGEKNPPQLFVIRFFFFFPR